MLALRSLFRLFVMQPRPPPTAVIRQYETGQFYFAPVLPLLVQPLPVSPVVFPFHALSLSDSHICVERLLLCLAEINLARVLLPREPCN
jgi:hypothetical protein